MRCASATRPRARAIAAGRAARAESGCCSSAASITGPAGEQVFGAALYDTQPEDRRPDAAVSASLGCGVPTAVADLREGETVLDLGSGAGADVLISARRVGPDRQGDRPRHDRRDARARATQRARGRRSRTSSSARATSRRSRSPDESVDVVISNCVLNLSGDKPRVIREAAQGPAARRAFRDLRRDRRRGHGRRHACGHAEVDRLHRRRAHAPRVRDGARARPASIDDRDPRDPPRPRARRRRRSSARASRCAPGWLTRHRNPAQRPADALPALGGIAVVAVRDRPRPATSASGRRMTGGGPRADLLRALLADGRRGAHHDQVLRPRRRLRQRGGGDLPGSPSRSTRRATCSSTPASRTRSSPTPM